MGAKGVGESPNVGSPAAFVNAVIDALSPLGVRAHRHAAHARQGLARHSRRENRDGLT
jgi:CO/xanthine dehydrogenase Mo-binding subunit